MPVFTGVFCIFNNIIPCLLKILAVYEHFSPFWIACIQSLFCNSFFTVIFKHKSSNCSPDCLNHSGVQKKGGQKHTFVMTPSRTHFLPLIQRASRHIETKSLDTLYNISEFLLFCLKSALEGNIIYLQEEMQSRMFFASANSLFQKRDGVICFNLLVAWPGEAAFYF